MKSCPSCHQVYPDNGPDYCTNDGTPLVTSTSEYNPGSAYNPGAGQQGGQWQAPPPPGYGYPPAGGGYPPYGYAPASGGGGGISKAALFTGIASAVMLFLVFIIAASGARSRDARAMVGIIAILMLLAALVAVILGIVALSMASKNPGVSKAGAIVGICLGALPLLLFFIGLAAGAGRF